MQKSDILSSQSSKSPKIDGWNDQVEPCCLANAVTFPMTLGEITLRISVALPLSVSLAALDSTSLGEQQRFPVLYLLDANASFASVVETNRRLSRRPDATQVAPAIIVGIDGDTEALYDSSLRKKLYSDLAGAEGEGTQATATQGAAAFLDFIRFTLRPMIERAYPTDADQQHLMGHSLAGYFTLWTLANVPTAFQGYAAISPSLWHNASTMEALTSGQWRQTPGQTAKSEQPSQTESISEETPRLFLAVGQWEESLAPWQHQHSNASEIAERRQERRMVSNLLTLGKALKQQLGEEKVNCRAYEDEDHASIFSSTLSRAMRHLLALEMIPGKNDIKS